MAAQLYELSVTGPFRPQEVSLELSTMISVKSRVVKKLFSLFEIPAFIDSLLASLFL